MLLNKSLNIHLNEDRRSHGLTDGPLLLMWGVFLWVMVGCAPPQPTSIEKSTETKNTRTFRVDLPRIIDLEALIPPLKHSDGTFRIDGLLMKPTKHFEDELNITGYVVGKSKCKRGAKECAKPYLWIADATGETEEKLRVVDLERKKIRHFKLNRKYVFTGRFSQSSKSGYVHSNGLLLYKSSQRVSQ